MKCYPTRRILMSLVIVICVAILLAMLVAFLPLLIIGCEGFIKKIKLDNPHIDSNYKEWENVSLQGLNTFCIPKGWTAQNDGGLYTITDDSGIPWAYGAVFGTENDRFDSYSDFIGEVYSCDIIEMYIDPFVQFAMMDGSDIDLLVIQDENSTHNVFCLQMMESAQVHLVWFLTADISVYQDQYDIAEAIIYSYAFEKTAKTDNRALS